MKCVLCSLLTAAMILFSGVCRADIGEGYFLKLGGSLNEPSLLTNKMLAAGVQRHLLGVFDYQLELGTFVDNSKPNDWQTVWGAAQIGLSIVNPGYYIKVFSGPAYVSKTDDHLSTPFEFTEDLEIGFVDKRGVGIGFGYKHFSNAGIQQPNLGRDFLFFKVMLP